MLIRHRFVDIASGVLTDRWGELGSEDATIAIAKARFYGEAVRCINDQTGQEFDLHPNWLGK